MKSYTDIHIDRKKVVWWLLTLSGLLIALSLGMQLTRMRTGENRFLFEFFNVDGEANLPASLSSLWLMVCSLLSWILLKISSEKAERNFWLVLTGIFAFFSADELLRFHEQLNEPLRKLFHLGGAFVFAWVIPGMLFILAVSLLMFPHFKRMNRMTRRKFLLAGIFYFGGAVVCEMVNGMIWTKFGAASPLYIIASHFEESMEFIGIILFINAHLFQISISRSRPAFVVQ